MRVIGFRVEPKQVHYAVAEKSGEVSSIQDLGKLTAPAAFSEAQSLDWYRNKIRTLIDEFHPDKVAVRYPEPSARQGQPMSTHRRVRIEGVVLEASYSKGKEIVTGPLATWSSLLGTKSAKEYLSRDTIRGVDLTSVTGKEQREALMSAIAVLEGGQ